MSETKALKAKAEALREFGRRLGKPDLWWDLTLTGLWRDDFWRLDRQVVPRGPSRFGGRDWWLIGQLSGRDIGHTHWDVYHTSYPGPDFEGLEAYCLLATAPRLTARNGGSKYYVLWDPVTGGFSLRPTDRVPWEDWPELWHRFERLVVDHLIGDEVV